MPHACEFSEAIIASRGFVNWIEPLRERHKSEAKRARVNAFSGFRDHSRSITSIPVIVNESNSRCSPLLSSSLSSYFSLLFKMRKRESIRFVNRTWSTAMQRYVNFFLKKHRDCRDPATINVHLSSSILFDIILFNYTGHTWPANHMLATRLLWTMVCSFFFFLLSFFHVAIFTLKRVTSNRYFHYRSVVYRDKNILMFQRQYPCQ